MRRTRVFLFLRCAGGELAQGLMGLMSMFFVHFYIFAFFIKIKKT